jgi:hypothetical protein
LGENNCAAEAGAESEIPPTLPPASPKLAPEADVDVSKCAMAAGADRSDASEAGDGGGTVLLDAACGLSQHICSIAHGSVCERYGMLPPAVDVDDMPDMGEYAEGDAEGPAGELALPLCTCMWL